ncbi:MAG: 3-deoxy-manno-octulosonate cytidylyltransferase [Armatimonas sp.]
MKTVVLIPARLAATRLPDKPLAEIAGKPMIQHVWERARKAQGIDGVFVATPDQRIADAVAGFGGEAILTRADHQTGTDRLAEAVGKLPDSVEVIVNVQGDEPRIDPATIEAAAAPLLADASLAMSSACCPLPEEQLSDPNAVKVVVALNGDALYFSRAAIPYVRDSSAGVIPKLHIGLYAYRREFLLAFPTLPRTPLERTESLEQLRALESGYRIRMIEIERAPAAVDTQEDLERVRALFAVD